MATITTTEAVGGQGDSTAPIGVSAQSRHRRRPVRRSTAPYLLLGLLFLAGYSAVVLLRYRQPGAVSPGTAQLAREVRDYAWLHAPDISVHGVQTDALGLHFSPVLALLAPVYRLFPSALTLLLAQALLFAVSVIIVSATAGRLWGGHYKTEGRGRALAVGVAYGLSWGLQDAVRADFQPTCFAVPLVALSLRNVLLKRWQRAGLWALPLVFVQEDLGLTVAAIGLVVFLQRRWATGALLGCFGVAALLLSVDWVIPHLSPTGGYAGWSHLPGGYLDLLAPLKLVQHLGTHSGTKAWTLVYLLAVTGFLALRSPLLLVAVPTLAWRFLADNPAYWGTGRHYSTVLMPIVFLAMVDAVQRCEERGGDGWLRRYAAQAAVPVVTAVALTLCVSLQLPGLSLVKPSSYRSAPVQPVSPRSPVPR